MAAATATATSVPPKGGVSRRTLGVSTPFAAAVTLPWTTRVRPCRGEAESAGAPASDEVLVVRPTGQSVHLTAGFAAGYGVPARQYTSYARALAALGWTAVVWSDASRRDKGSDSAASARFLDAVLQNAEGEVRMLAGHSRGAKLAVLARERVVARNTTTGSSNTTNNTMWMVLLDPVDGSDFAPSSGPDSALDSVTRKENRRSAEREEEEDGGRGGGEEGEIRTLILGTSAGGECAPEGVNWAAFHAAMPGSSVQVLERAGHLQLVDDRFALGALDVCPVAARPAVKDSVVRDAARAALVEWASRAASQDNVLVT